MLWNKKYLYVFLIKKDEIIINFTNVGARYHALFNAIYYNATISLIRDIVIWT